MAAPMKHVVFWGNLTRQRIQLISQLGHTQTIGQVHAFNGHVRNGQWPQQAMKCFRGYATSAKVEDDSIEDVLYKRLKIEVKGHEPEVINSYENFVTMAAQELGVNLSKISKPDKVIERHTLLKSIFVYKKHRVQYETRTHYRTFEMKYLTGSTADTLLEYIQRNLPEGMAMKVTKHRIESLPSHLKPPSGSSAETV